MTEKPVILTEVMTPAETVSLAECLSSSQTEAYQAARQEWHEHPGGERYEELMALASEAGEGYLDVLWDQLALGMRHPAEEQEEMLARLANPSDPGVLAAHSHAAGSPDDAGTSPAREYTREQVSTAVNAAADLVRDSLDLSDRDGDLVNLIVNAALTLLDEPGLSLDDAIRLCYETDPAEVRDWCSEGS